MQRRHKPEERWKGERRKGSRRRRRRTKTDRKGKCERAEFEALENMSSCAVSYLDVQSLLTFVHNPKPEAFTWERELLYRSCIL